LLGTFIRGGFVNELTEEFKQLFLTETVVNIEGPAAVEETAEGHIGNEVIEETILSEVCERGPETLDEGDFSDEISEVASTSQMTL
jgi:hypothetical protein